MALYCSQSNIAIRTRVRNTQNAYYYAMFLLFVFITHRQAKPRPKGCDCVIIDSLARPDETASSTPVSSCWITPNRMMLCRTQPDLKGYGWHYIKPSEESSSVKMDDLSNCPHRFQYWPSILFPTMTSDKELFPFPFFLFFKHPSWMKMRGHTLWVTVEYDHF